VISISSSGCAPALSVRLRERLERTVTETFGRFAELVGGLRGAIAARHPDAAERKRLWYELVDDTMPLLDAGRLDEAVARIPEVMDIAVERDSTPQALSAVGGPPSEVASKEKRAPRLLNAN
jgi:siroheme synthase-like protein